MIENRNISISYKVHPNRSSLSSEIRELFDASDSIMRDAYAPYSDFLVGAALLLANGEIVKGSNQENAAFPSGLCAERTAFFWAGANYPNINIRAVAISARKGGAEQNVPVTPCGACRQSMLEFEFKQGKPIQVFMEGENGNIIELASILDLLPFCFNGNSLK